MRDLIPPKPVFVESSKAVDNDGNGEGDDEDADDGTTGTHHLPWAQKNGREGFKNWRSKVKFSPNHVLGVMSP